MPLLPLYLNISNTTGRTQGVSLFNNSGLGMTGSQIPTYEWDMSGELANAALYASNVLVLVARPNGNAGQYKTFSYTAAAPFTNISQVLSALNSLGAGVFSNPAGNFITAPTGGALLYSSISLTNFYQSLLSPNVQYNYFGALVYNAGWQANGVGSFSRINPSVPFWINPSMNLTDGRMNAESIWNNVIPVPSQQQVGFVFSYFSPAGGTVYMGLSADDVPTVYLNNNILVSFDITAMGLNIASILGPSYNDGKQAFSFWHIFPVQLAPGWNLFQFQNYNNVLNGGLGVELYNNTAAQILAATGYNDLDLLFGSASYAGQQLF